jgi:hypothetical protein
MATEKVEEDEVQYVSLDIDAEDATELLDKVKPALGEKIASSLKFKSKLHMTIFYSGKEQPGHASTNISEEDKKKKLERLQVYQDTPAKIKVIGVYSHPKKSLIAAKVVVEERMLKRWGVPERIESEKAANEAIDERIESEKAANEAIEQGQMAASGSTSSNGSSNGSVTIGLHITLGHGPEAQPYESNDIPVDASFVPVNDELLGTVAFHGYLPR